MKRCVRSVRISVPRNYLPRMRVRWVRYGSGPLFVACAQSIFDTPDPIFSVSGVSSLVGRFAHRAVSQRITATFRQRDGRT